MAARVPFPIMPDSFSKKKKRDEEEDDTQDVELNEIDSISDDRGEIEVEENATEAAEPPASDNEPEDDDMTLDEHAEVVMAILKPVAITMFAVVAIVYALHFSQASPTSLTFMIYKEKSTDSTPVKLGGALLDAGVFVILVIVVTFFLFLLYKYRCLKLIYGWLMMSVAMMLSMFTAILYIKIFRNFDWPLDWITFTIFIWNFGVIGMFAIFWRSPTRTTQAYLIIISVLMACFFTRLAEWTTWMLLIAIAIYDLFAVLCPRGPLKLLVDLSQERDEPIPALLYNGSVILVGMAKSEKAVELKEEAEEDDIEDELEFSVDEIPINGEEEVLNEVEALEGEEEDFSSPDTPLLAEEEPKRDEESEVDKSDRLRFKRVRGAGASVKLGLGDFIFYSVLMGRAAMYDITTVFTCFIAIITGLFFTLILLAVFHKALPALPFSIFLGTIFYLLTTTFLVPYVQILGSTAVFV